MAKPSVLEQARAGDGAAIAALLNHDLQPKGLQVRGERHSYTLHLWLTGKVLPSQRAVVTYVRRVLEQLQVTTIGILEIEAAGETESWRVSVSVLDAAANGEAAPQGAEVGSGTPEGIDTGPQGRAIARAYQVLALDPGASLAVVEDAYFKARAAMLRRGDRAALEPLKWAHQTLREVLTGSPEAAIPEPAPAEGEIDPEPPSTFVVQALLQDRGVPALVAQQGNQLHVRWPAVRVANPKQVSAQVYALLAQQDFEALGLGEVTTLVISGLNGRDQVVWQKTLALPRPRPGVEDTDLLSFQNRYSNGLVFPVLVGLGLIMNALPIVNLLLQGIKIWLHEFGHATIAWLAGRQALPLPLGWTTLNPQRSLGVYLGVLLLLSLLFWSGRREQKRWPMVLAVGLGVVQFAMTWLISPQTFDMLFAFGGIGGELYLSTLLMVSFFFPLPHYWRWDFYRFPVVVGAAFTFWGQFWLWKRVRFGQASIPFGSLWGSPDHGDMNQLANQHGWTPGDIITTYNGIANLCLLVLVGVYGYGLVQQHRQWFVALSQRWMARF